MQWLLFFFGKWHCSKGIMSWFPFLRSPSSKFFEVLLLCINSNGEHRVSGGGEIQLLSQILSLLDLWSPPLLCVVSADMPDCDLAIGLHPQVVGYETDGWRGLAGSPGVYLSIYLPIYLSKNIFCIYLSLCLSIYQGFF